MYRTVDRRRRAHVLTHDADIRRNMSAGYFQPGEQLNQLALTARGVFGGHDADVDIQLAALEYPFQRVDSLRLVVLDADHDMARAQQVADNTNAAQNIGGTLTHQHIVSRDVKLALGGVDDQCVDDMVITQMQLRIGREARAAHAGYAALADMLDQGGRLQPSVIFQALMLDPLILTIGLQRNAV